MPVPPPSTTLATIQNKVRRLTRSPSEVVLSTDNINEYINTFILYDFPEHLRLFFLKTTFYFFTQPNIDTYAPSSITTDPLYQFDQIYTSFEGPIYIAGFEARLSQSREEFYRIFPFVNNVQQTGISGDGSTLTFSGFVTPIPLLRGQVVFTSKDANNNGLILSDSNTSDGTLTSPDGVSTGTINYLTGAFTLNWNVAPAANQPIISETYPYTPSRPTLVLYYDTQFTVRPIPDQSYKIIMDAYIRPTYLMDSGQSPQLQQWWQYIAYGAAKKVFEDRMDLDSVALIMPEYKKQEALVLRSTLVQQANERVATIYTDQSQGSGYYNSFFGNF
jgi:hypothetical protein